MPLRRYSPEQLPPNPHYVNDKRGADLSVDAIHLDVATRAVASNRRSNNVKFQLSRGKSFADGRKSGIVGHDEFLLIEEEQNRNLSRNSMMFESGVPQNRMKSAPVANIKKARELARIEGRLNHHPENSREIAGMARLHIDQSTALA